MNSGGSSSSLDEVLLSPAITGVFKRDDDARLIYDEDSGRLLLETTVEDAQHAGLHNPTGDVIANAFNAIRDETLLERTALQPQRDVRLQVLCRLFIFDTCVMLLISLASIPFYYIDIAHIVLVWSLMFSSFTATLSYIVMFATRIKFTRVAMCAIITWIASLVIICGCVSGLLDDIAPQLILLCWLVQSLSLILYSRYVTKVEEMRIGTAIWIMSGVSILLVALYLVLFFIERTWTSFIITATIGGILGTAYRTWELYLTDVTRYTLSTSDGWLSYIQFYSEPIVLLSLFVPSSPPPSGGGGSSLAGSSLASSSSD